MDKIIVIGLLFLVCICGAILLIPQHSNQPPTTCTSPVILFFYSDTCSHCQNVMPFIKGIERNYSGVDVKFLEVSKNATNAKTFKMVNEQKDITKYGVPEVIIWDTVLIGDIEIPKKLEALIPECARRK